MSLIHKTLERIHFFHKISPSENRYVWLVFSMLTLIVVCPFFERNLFSKFYFSLVSSLVVIIALYADIERKSVDYLEVALALCSILASVANAIWDDIFIQSLSTTILILFYLYFSVELITKIVLTEVVSSNLLYAAMAGFLSLGILGALCASLVEDMEPSAYNLPKGIVHMGYEHFIYFSFISITTVGYGDMTPNHPIAKSLAILICIAGHLYTVIIFGIIIGKYLNTKEPKNNDIN